MLECSKCDRLFDHCYECGRLQHLGGAIKNRVRVNLAARVPWSVFRSISRLRFARTATNIATRAMTVAPVVEVPWRFASVVVNHARMRRDHGLREFGATGLRAPSSDD